MRFKYTQMSRCDLARLDDIHLRSILSSKYRMYQCTNEVSGPLRGEFIHSSPSTIMSDIWWGYVYKVLIP